MSGLDRCTSLPTTLPTGQPLQAATRRLHALQRQVIAQAGPGEDDKGGVSRPQKEVCVLGAGVIGLTAAVRLAEEVPNVHVTVLAELWGADTTSDGAGGECSGPVPACLGSAGCRPQRHPGTAPPAAADLARHPESSTPHPHTVHHPPRPHPAGLWKPYALGSTPAEDIVRWGQRTFDHYMELVRSPDAGAAGVIMTSSYQLWAEPVPDPLWKEIVPNFRHLTQKELRWAPAEQSWHCQ